MNDVRDNALSIRNNNVAKAALGAAFFEALANRCLPVSIMPKDSWIITQGQPVESVYLVREGRVLITRLTANGNETILGIAQPGDFFGEIALLGDGVAPFSAMALDRAVISTVRKPDFVRLLDDPALSLALLQTLALRCADAWDQIEVMGSGPLQDKLGPALSWLCRSIGERTPEGIEIRLNQTQLARMIGATRESLNRQMRVLRKASILQVKKTPVGRCLLVRSPERVAAAPRRA
jgi:CRP/FNR family transcriptional regulator